MKNKTKEENAEINFIIDCIVDELKKSNDAELLNIIYMLLLKNRNESLYR
jgi:hypothetical protein